MSAKTRAAQFAAATLLAGASLFMTGQPANAAQPEGECFIVCPTPKRGLYQHGCKFFCDVGHHKQIPSKTKNPGRHGGIDLGPTWKGDCSLFCGEGYRQRKYKDPGPLFPELGF